MKLNIGLGAIIGWTTLLALGIVIGSALSAALGWPTPLFNGG